MSPYRVRARYTFATPKGNLSRQCISQSPMSGEYFGRLIATGEWGVCQLPSGKVRYTKNNFQNVLKVKIISSYIKCMMFFGVTVQEID